MKILNTSAPAAVRTTVLGLSEAGLLEYAIREETRHEHLAVLRQIYGYRALNITL